MVLPETTGAAAKLSFGRCIGAARETVFGNFGRFLKLATLPFLLALLFTVLEIPVLLYFQLGELALLVLDLVPFALLGIAVSRVVLLEEQARFLPPNPMGRRTWAYIGYTLLMGLIVMVPFIIAIVALFAASGDVSFSGQESNWLFLIGFAVALFMLYVLCRLSLVFPALSVDQKLGLGGSWRLAAGSSLRLFGVFLGIFLFSLLVALVGSLSIGEDISIGVGGTFEFEPGNTVGEIITDRLPAMIWSTVVAILGAGLMAGAFASAYAQLSGWSGPRDEILERFE